MAPAARPVALVADDASDSRLLLSRIADASGFDTIEVETGNEAAEVAISRHVDLILLDVMMPEATGLEALARMREHDLDVPVVVVTGFEEPGFRERALELGAVGFVRKPIVPADVSFLVERVRSAIDEAADIVPALGRVRSRRTTLELENQIQLLGSVVGFLARELRLAYPGLRLPLTRVRIALTEAIVNAIEHGNLEIGPREKERALADPGALSRLIAVRSADRRYRDRRVVVVADYRPAAVRWTIRDQGPGFPADLRRPRPVDGLALRGRGLLLMRHVMSQVTWNRAGNQVSLRLDLAAASPASGQAHA